MEVLWSVSPPDEEDEEEREFRQLCEVERRRGRAAAACTGLLACRGLIE
jgi:hypothetical protein